MSDPITIFDILREANEDEENTNAETPDTNTQDTADTPADDNQDDANGGDDDFSIDASLDDNGGDEAGDDDMGGGDDLGGGDTGSTDGSGDSSDNISDGEVVDSNTDIFNSLSAEEQQMKIIELKSLYQQLYNSCDEITTRLSGMELEDHDVLVVNRLNNSLFSLKKYIKDYLIHTFPNKSFVENDIMFNHFLYIIDNIKDVLVKHISKFENMDKQ